MILTELQQYLSKSKKASLAELETHFHIDAEAIRGMLELLIRKGRIRKMADGKKCGGCPSCKPESLEFYELITPP